MIKSSCKMMIFLLGLSILAPSIGMAKSTIDWRSYEEGFALSRQEGKKLFVHFFADW